MKKIFQYNAKTHKKFWIYQCRCFQNRSIRMAVKQFFENCIWIYLWPYVSNVSHSVYLLLYTKKIFTIIYKNVKYIFNLLLAVQLLVHIYTRSFAINPLVIKTLYQWRSFSTYLSKDTGIEKWIQDRRFYFKLISVICNYGRSRLDVYLSQSITLIPALIPDLQLFLKCKQCSLKYSFLITFFIFDIPSTCNRRLSGTWDSKEPVYPQIITAYVILDSEF